MNEKKFIKKKQIHRYKIVSPEKNYQINFCSGATTKSTIIFTTKFTKALINFHFVATSKDTHQ